MNKNKDTRYKIQETKRLAGFTLIEAIIALMIFSMAGIFLLSASAQNFRNVKLNELRSEMENAGIEGINEVKLAYNNRWENLPAGSTTGFYKSDQIKTTGLAGCEWESGQQNVYLDPSTCDEVENINKGTYLRAIAVTSVSKTVGTTTLEAKQIEVVISCTRGRCDGTVLPPYRIQYIIYR